MRKVLLFISLTFTGLQVVAQKAPIKVLFIGNSLTFVNDLPGTLQKVAHSAGDSIYVDASAIPGYTLYQHVRDTATLNKIKAKKWDYVVIQEQSQIPSFPPAQVDTQFYPYAHILDSLVHRNDSCTHTVFYLTFGHKYGDKANCGGYPILCTYDGVQSRLRQSYLHVADTNKAMAAPVGIAWYHSWHTDSSISLWQSDFTHPTVAGAYLSACTFYATLMRKDCSKVTYITSGITAKQATFLKNIASHTVLDSLATWYIGAFDPHAAFTIKPSGFNMAFNNISKYATHYYWIFGDGGTSYQRNPTHTYSSKAPFKAECIAYRDCMADTFKQSINWTWTDDVNSLSGIKVYPNPSKDKIIIENNAALNLLRFEVSDALGRTIVSHLMTEKKFTWMHNQIAPGIYIVKLYDNKGHINCRTLVIE